MQQTLSDPRFAVFDDVLPGEAHAELWSYIQRQRYATVHKDGWMPAWRPGDGTPLSGPTVARLCSSAERLLADVDVSRIPVQRCPTGTAIDRVMEAVAEGATSSASLVGTANEHWAAITGTVFAYPAGAGLSWHTDSGPYAGAFIYYAHPEWNVYWGGELLISDAPRIQHDIDARLPMFDDGRRHASMLEIGTGRFVMPRPNRLVILTGGVSHMIAPVSPAAGHHVRCSIAGFFVTPAGVGQFARDWLT